MKTNHYRQSLLHLIQHLRPKLGLYSLILLVGAVLLFNSVRIKNISTLSRIEQQVATRQQDPNYIAAQKALKNGLLLSKLNSDSSRTKAIKEYETALQLWQKLGDKAGQSNTLVALGQAYSGLGKKKEALENYKGALELRRAVNDKNGQVTVLGYIASLERSQGNINQSHKTIKNAIALIEDLRKSYTNTDEQSAYFASVQQYYKFHIDLLMELHNKNPTQGYDALALYTSERSQARGLVELLKQAKADLCKGIDPSLIEAEERLVSKRDDAETLLSQYLNQPQQPVELIAATQKEITNIIKEQEEINAKIRAQNPDREKVLKPKLGRDILQLPQIQKLLDKDTVLLEYSLGEERSYLWAVTQNSLSSYVLPGRQQIETAASKFRSGVLIPDSIPPEVIQASNEFSKIILAPVADKLPGKRLVIVGDGALQDIPFAALPDPNQIRNYQPLMLNHEIINLPSASTLAIQRQKLATRPEAPKALAIFADPVYSPTDERVTGKPDNNQLGPELVLQNSDLEKSTKNLKRSGFDRLQGTFTEAQGILNLIPASSRMQAMGFDANYTWATSSEVNQFRIIHFATHGFVNYENPELSGIVLSLVDKKGKSIPGYLRLGYLFNLDYSAELIVLSACETGLGKNVSGEGLVGLTRGLMYAGGKRLVVSLWNVNDEGTSVLMQEFYKEMLQQNKTPANALRAAQKKLWENPEWQSPYYWAGFTVQGEWQ